MAFKLSIFPFREKTRQGRNVSISYPLPEPGTEENERKLEAPVEPAPDYDERRGTPLNTHHGQSYLSISWLVLLIAFVCLIEYTAWAHSLPSDTTRNWQDWRAFGRQGTRWRKGVVQGLSVTRTILAILHVPIMTGTLAATLPPLTQKLHGYRSPPKLTASQLFLLADRTWCGAGGWISALKVGDLPWAWWRLTFLTMLAFLGFPLITIGYYTTAEQFWHSIDYIGLDGWELQTSTADAIGLLRGPLENWMHTKPQRNLGDPALNDGGWNKTIWGLARGYTAMQTILLEGDLSFFPPAFDVSPLGHFVSLTPKDANGLVVANTVGFIQTLQCQPFPSGREPVLLDLSGPEWGCKIDCNTAKDKDLCHTRTSLGKRDGQHISQVASCAWANNVTSWDGITLTTEVAIKINPDYKASGLTPPFSSSSSPPYSFMRGDRLSGTDYYVEVINCTMGYIPGHAVVDSIIRKFMHFTPLVVKGAPRPPPGELPQLKPAEEEKLWLNLERLLNVTTTLPLNFLHEYFLESNYAKDRRDNNSALPVWFGVQHPGDPHEQLTQTTSERGPSSSDQILIDNMVRVNGTIFKNSLIGHVNSTLIEQLKTFFVHSKQYAFIYETDVKIVRGSMPIGLAPIILLLPVFFVVYHSLSFRNIPTWTENLDSWAMFKLGREWGEETTGQGAVELRDSWQARRIPGYVGAATGTIILPGGKAYNHDGIEIKGDLNGSVGYLQLGGRESLRDGVNYQ